MMKKLKELIHNVAHLSDKGIRYVTKDKVITQSYKDTYLTALKFLQVIEAYQLPRGSYVSVINSDMQAFIISVWALTLGGYTPVAMSPIIDYTETDAGFKKFYSAVKKLNINLIIGEIDETKLQNDDVFKTIKICKFDQIQSVDSNAEIPAGSNFDNQQNPALVMLTSGSTGEPKIVPLTHENLLSAIPSKAEFYLLNSNDISLNFLPLDHVGGIIEFHLLQCYAKCNQIHVSKEYILSNTNNFLKLIDQYKATMSMAPNFFIELINKHLDPNLNLDLSSLRILLSGGDFVVRNTIHTFAENLSRRFKLNKNCIMPAFGMTETCAGVIYSNNWDCCENIKFLNLGKPIKNASIQIKNNKGVVAKEGESGELEIKGPMVIKGYYDAKDNVGVFNDGWMKTGDVGFIKEGLLYLTGRIKHVIVVNGINYTCQEIELLIRENVGGLTKDSIAVIPVNISSMNVEQFVILFSCKNKDDGSAKYNMIKKIKTLCFKYMGSLPYAVLPTTEDDIGRTSLGKIDRSKIQDDFESGKLNTLLQYAFNLEKENRKYVAPQSDIEISLVNIFSEVLHCAKDQISLEDRFLDLGATSIMAITLQQRIMDVFSVNLPITTIMENPSLKEVCEEIVLQKTPGYKPQIKPYNPVVKLNSVGNKPPIFCIHPGVGEVLVFVGLAKKFHGERPFYALRARGFNEGETFFTSYDEIVDTYISAMKKVQPNPPYYVAGYSYGACLAYGISHKLQKNGEDVAFTGIINLPPYIKERMDQLDLLEGLLHLCMFVGLCKKQDLPKIKETIKHLTFEQQVEYMLTGDEELDKRIVELNIDKEKLTKWTLLAQSLLEIGKTFMPYKTNKVRKLDIFHAIALFDTKEEWLKKLSEWQKYAIENNEYHEVPGEHYTMMDNEHVNEFYKIFQKVLERCDKDYLNT